MRCSSHNRKGRADLPGVFSHQPCHTQIDICGFLARTRNRRFEAPVRKCFHTTACINGSSSKYPRQFLQRKEHDVSEYRPVPSTYLSRPERPRCPACVQARMLLSKIEPGPSGFDRRTFKCRKCGHVHMMVISSDPIKSEVIGQPFWAPGSSQ